MSDINYHFQLKGDKIVCWNGNDGWTEIATVILERPCRHLLRNAQFVEDVEKSVDTMLGAVSTNLRALWKDTDGRSAEAHCPEVSEVENE